MIWISKLSLLNVFCDDWSFMLVRLMSCMRYIVFSGVFGMVFIIWFVFILLGFWGVERFGIV